MRIAIFGGTFDPIHRGHLRIARHVTRLLNLDRVVFVTAARPPHKAAMSLTHACDRHAMVALAVRGEKKFVASNLELSSTVEKNYSIDTLTTMRSQLRARDELFFIMGADQFSEFGTWKSSEKLLSSVALVVVSRPGLPLKTLLQRCDKKVRCHVKLVSGIARRPGRRRSRLSAAPPVVYFVPDVKIGISSTSIRDRIAAGKPVRRLLDPAVADYIRENRLYRQRT